MQEEWRPVVGFEGLYVISNTGVVKGLKRVVKYTQNKHGRSIEVNYPVPERIIKQGRRKDGYADVPLSRNGVSENYLVHRLLAEAWIPNPNPERLTFVNHIDSDPTNNSLDNLEWTTPGQNTIHAVQHLRNKQCIAVYCSETDTVYPSMGQADRELGLPQGCTSDHIKHDRKCKFHLRIATAEEIASYSEHTESNEGLSYKQDIPTVTNPINTPVKCIDTGEVFESVSEAARHLKVSVAAVEKSIKESHCCKGYTFCYVDTMTESEERAYMLKMRTKSQGNRGICYWRDKDISASMPLINLEGNLHESTSWR